MVHWSHAYLLLQPDMAGTSKQSFLRVNLGPGLAETIGGYCCNRDNMPSGPGPDENICHAQTAVSKQLLIDGDFFGSWVACNSRRDISQRAIVNCYVCCPVNVAI